MPILLITRPDAGARRLAGAVRRAAWGRTLDIVQSPLMTAEPVAATVPGPVAGLVLTSAEGVAGARRLGLGGLPAWCVGPATAEAARAAGFAPEALPEGGDAEALIDAIRRARPEGPLLHPRGAVSRGDVAARLSAAGLPCAEVVVYRQVARPLTPAARAALSGASPVLLPVFSPRSARLLAREAGVPAAPCHVVAISAAAAAEAAPLRPASSRVASAPDASAMLDAVRHVTATLAAGGTSLEDPCSPD